MMVSIKLPHVSPRHVRPGSMVHPTCSAELFITVKQDRETDAPYLYTEDYDPKCSECGHVWSPDERKEIDRMAIEAVMDEEDEDLDFDDDLDDDLDDEEDDDFDDDDDDLDDVLDDEDEPDWDDEPDDDEDDHQELLEDRV